MKTKIKIEDLTAGYIRKLFATGSFKNAPFMNTKDGKRIYNPQLSSTVVTPKGVLKALEAAAANAVQIPIPDLVYEAPIIIKQGDPTSIKNRNFRSNDSGVPAIQVWTNDPVEISGCTIVSSADMIKASGGTTLNIHHNNFYGNTPTGNEQWGRALNNYHPKQLTFEHNYVEHTGGLLVDHTDGGIQTVNIRYNAIRNTDKRRVDLTSGDHRAGILFNTVSKVNGEIAWNFFENLTNLSHIEDNINMYNSGGIAGNIYKIHDNYIIGAYPYPLTADFYTGSGITIDGDPTTNQMSNMSQFIDAYNNQVISTCNACMNIAAGHDIHFYNNIMLSSGKFPDGTQSDRFWGGCCIWDASNVGAANFTNNTIKGNTIGYVRHNVSVPLPERQDWVVVNGSPISVQAGDNTSLPNPITLDTENSELPKWQKKIKDNGITIGVGDNVVVVQPSDLVIKIGKTGKGKLIFIDDKGVAVTFKNGTLKVVPADTTIATISIDAAEQNITVVPLKAGKTIGVLSLTTNGDKLYSKTFNVEVQSISVVGGEVFDVKIEWVIS